MELPETSSKNVGEFDEERIKQLEKIEERPVSRFEPAGIAELLRLHGFNAIEEIDFREIAARFGGGISGLAPGNLGIRVVHVFVRRGSSR